MLAVALGMGLMSALCACGNRESEGNTMEMIGFESDEANIGNQSVRNSSKIDQTEQEAAMAAGYETRENHVEYHVIRGADHGYLGEDFNLAVSYIRDFLNAEQAAAQG